MRVITSVCFFIGLFSTWSNAASIEDEFRSPPMEYRPETWFHVIGYNMNKEGLTKDLEAIKAAGLQGIHLFCRGGNDFPDVDQVIPLSPEWFSLMGHAASECERLGLSFTLQNCGGWAMAGGPWVPVEEAQRELVQTTFHFKNGVFDKSIPISKEFLKDDMDYKDVSVIAFPAPKGDDLPVLIPDGVESNNKAVPWEKIVNPQGGLYLSGKNSRGIMKKNDDRYIKKAKGKDTYVQFRFDHPVTIRSLRIPSTAVVAPDSKILSDIDLVLETIDKGKRVKIATLRVPDGCWMDKQYDITLSVPEVTTKEFRITFVGKQEPFLGFLFLQSKPRAHNWEAKAAFALRSLMQDDVLQYSEECYIDPATILDLSDKLQVSNKLNWSTPKGDWTIIRFGHVNMGSVNSPSPKELQGWECSKIDKAALENHLRKGMIGQLNKPGGACGDGKLKGLLADSWERMIPSWTMDKETLFDEFMNRRGYDMRLFLPAMAGYLIKDQSETEKFLRDLRETMDDLYVDNFFAHFTTLANDMGARSYIEGATGEVLPGDALRYYGAADIPMTEFWYRRTALSDEMLDYKPVKYAASAAHLYNKKRVAAEACTEGGSNWTEDFYCVKALIDRHFAFGVNHLVFHTFTHNPKVEVYPGSTFGGSTGFPFVRNQTWWEHMPAFTDYLSRCQYMLQQGEFAADVLWYLGDELERPPYQMAAFPEGYNYDHLNSEVLSTRLSVKDGMLHVKDGGDYRVILMRNSQRMMRSTAERLRELVHAGAVILGNKPQESPSLMDGPQDIAALEAIADELWSDGPSGMKRAGKGKVYWGLPLETVLRRESIEPDVVVPANVEIQWIHRRAKDADIYFLSYLGKQSADVSLSFRVRGKAPEIWDAFTGERRSAGVWRDDAGRVSVALSFPPEGSSIVVFRKDDQKPHWTKLTRNGQVLLDSAPGWRQTGLAKGDQFEISPTQFVAWEDGTFELSDANGDAKRVTSQASSLAVDGPWTLAFDPGWDAPATLELPKLIPLTEHREPAVRYYSGTVTYRKTIQLTDKKGKTLLDLGDVQNIAEVRCNEKNVGVRWRPPFQYDLSDAARAGVNDLEIKVTNTWRNQLIYDQQRPKNQKKTWTTNPPRNKTESPKPSGLIGPVSIRSTVPQSL